MRIVIFLLLALNLNAQMVRFGGNISGITSTELATDTFRIRANFNDITGVSNGTQLLAGDIFWNPPLNSGDTCRRMVVISADTLYSSFVVFTVNTLGQGNPSTQNSKVMRETTNQNLDYIPQGGDQALRECISQYYSNILDQIIGTGGGLSSVLVDSVTIYGDGLNVPLYIDTTFFFTQGAFKDSLGDGQFQQEFIADGITAVYQVDSILPTEKRNVFVYWNGQGIDKEYITNYQPSLGSLELSFIPNQGDRVVVKWFDASAFAQTFGGSAGVDSVFTDGVTALGTGLLTDKIRVDTSVIATQNDISVKLETVTTDMFLIGDGTVVSPLGIDTMYVASKAYVDQSIAGSGLGDITGVNETPQYGIIGGSSSGAVLLSVDTSVIGAKTWVQGEIIDSLANYTNTVLTDSLGQYISRIELSDSLTNYVSFGDTLTSIATKTDLSSKLDSVFVDMFLFGNGTQSNPLSIDTMYVASKEYVDNSIAGAGAGDITGVNEFGGYGLLGGASSGAVTLTVDTSIITARSYLTANSASTNTPSTYVLRDASGNFSAGTITATTFSGTASQVANTLTRGTYLTGGNYNGSSAETWAVDATSANTASKVVARDGSGNFSANEITANKFNGTATQVSQTLTRGAFLTGGDYTGATARTWAVDTSTIAAKSWVSSQLGGGAVTASNGAANKLAIFSSATNVDGGSRWRLGTQADPVLTNSTSSAYYTDAALTDKFSVFGKSYFDTATVGSLVATTFNATNFGVTNLTVTNQATFNGSVANSIFSSTGQLGIQETPSAAGQSLTTRNGAILNNSKNSTGAGNIIMRSLSQDNMFFMSSFLNSIAIGGAAPNDIYNLIINKGLRVNDSQSGGSFDGLLVSGQSSFNLLNVSASNSSVGINTEPSSNYKLDVNGITRIFNNGLMLQNSSTGIALTDGTYMSNSGFDFVINNRETGGLNLYTNNNGTNNIYINSSGNVGIGKTNQTYKLDVNGEVNATGLRINGTPVGANTINNNADNRIVTGSNTANTLNAESTLSYSDGYLLFSSSTAGNEMQFYNTTTGTGFSDGTEFVLTGIDFNIYNRETSGDINIMSGGNTDNRITVKNNGSVVFAAYSAGTLTTDNFGVITATGSDGRYKTITKPLEYGINSIMKLNPIHYKWNEDSGQQTEKEQIGLIAQNVREAIPGSVLYDETETKLINYDDRAVIATLVKGMQEQQEQIEELKKEVARLKKNVKID